MKNHWVLSAVIVVLVFSAPMAASAQGWDFSLGLQMVNVGSDLGEIVDNGFGLSLGASYRLNPMLALDLALVSSAHSETVFGTDMSYVRMDLGGKVYFLVSPALDAYAVAGLAFHSLTFDLFYDEFDGTSLFFGGGVEIPAGPNGAVEIGLRTMTWDADWVAPPDPKFTVDSSTTTIGAAYHFRMP